MKMRFGWLTACVCVAVLLAGGAGTARAAGAPDPHDVSNDGSDGPLIYVMVFSHNEEPGANYPNFAQDRSAYERLRGRLVKLSRYFKKMEIPWNWGSEWNFLEAVKKYEVNAQSPSLLNQTNGKNIVWYLKANGAEIDPHSHEHSGYNYADVAHLIKQCSVTPSSVVGGHIWDPDSPNFQNWPRFVDGIRGKKYGKQAFWKATILTGAGTSDHVNDPICSGVWRPKSAQKFFTHSPGGKMLSIGKWNPGKADHEGTCDMIGKLMTSLKKGDVPRDKMYTSCFAFFPNGESRLDGDDYEKYLTGEVFERLLKWRGSGPIRFIHFEDVPNILRNRYGGKGYIHGPFYPHDVGVPKTHAADEVPEPVRKRARKLLAELGPGPTTKANMRKRFGAINRVVGLLMGASGPAAVKDWAPRQTMLATQRKVARNARDAPKAVGTLLRKARQAVGATPKRRPNMPAAGS